MTYSLPKNSALVLRTCASDLTSRDGQFQWPASGEVSAPDWRATTECGNGLHGFLWGEGDGDLASWDAEAKWLVVEVEAATIIDLEGKVKFPRGNVVFCGDRLAATTFIQEHGASGKAVVGGTATAGDSGTATAGDSGTATAGDRGTATAGDSGTATAGYSGTATAGDSGTATAGDRGTILIKHWDGKTGRYRIAIGYVGEDGILPNREYVIRDGKLELKGVTK